MPSIKSITQNTPGPVTSTLFNGCDDNTRDLRALLSPPHGTRLVRVLLYVLAGVESRPERAHEGMVITVVEVSEKRLDGPGGLLSVVEGDAAGATVSTGKDLRRVIFGTYENRWCTT